MNNFEEKLFVDYLERLLPVLDLRSYSFDDTLEFFLREFKVKRSLFQFDEEGIVLGETIRQQNNLRKRLKVVLEQLKESCQFGKQVLKKNLK